MGEPLRTYAAEAGLVMRRPSLTPYTMYALEATEHAQRQGKFDTFHHEAYKSLWEDGKDLGDLSVIQEIAEKCDIDWPDLSQRLESGYYRAAIQQDHKHAVEMGIQAIPSFLIGNVLFSGAQPDEVFKTIMKRLLDSDDEEINEQHQRQNQNNC